MQKEFAMPRRARMYLPNFTYHIVQRGNNHQACFFAKDDYLYYLERLRCIMPRYGVKLHAYCLMTNHIHLLMTPKLETSISDTLRVVGSSYAQYINKTYRRTGTLWEGRHKASAVESESYLLRCYRYIELNPVNANMVESPEEYRWSSYHSNAWGDASTIVTPHLEYLSLGKDTESRCFHYRELFKVDLSQQDLHSFKKAAHYSVPVGSDRFVEQIKIELNNQSKA